MENKLQHYGILGMRWGVRRTKAQLRRARGPDAPRKVTKEQYDEAKKKAIKSGDKATIERWKSHLTNQELREALDRCDLNRRLSSVDQKSVESGRQTVVGVLQDAGKVINFVKALPGTYEIIRNVNNSLNTKKLPKLDGSYYKDQGKTKPEPTAEEIADRKRIAQIESILDDRRKDKYNSLSNDSLLDAAERLKKKYNN